MAERTVEELRHAARNSIGDPFVKALCEAMVIYRTEGKLDGFVPQPDIRDRLGDGLSDQWDELCRKMREALGETTDPRQLE